MTRESMHPADIDTKIRRCWRAPCGLVSAVLFLCGGAYVDVLIARKHREMSRASTPSGAYGFGRTHYTNGSSVGYAVGSERHRRMLSRDAARTTKPLRILRTVAYGMAAFSFLAGFGWSLHYMSLRRRRAALVGQSGRQA